MSYPGKLILLLGVSGAGKGTVIKELLKKDLGLSEIISYTTRAMRPDEQQDVHYHYGMSQEEFQKWIAAGEFIEYAQSHWSDRYGTKIKDITDKLVEGKHVLKELNIDGIIGISEHSDVWEVTRSIFLDVDNELMKQRIQSRAALAGTTMSDEELAIRLHSAERERELARKYCTIIIDGSGSVEEETERVVTLINQYLHEEPQN